MTSPALAPEAVTGLQAATERLNQHAARLAATGDPIADLVADSAAMTQAGLRMIVDASLTLQAQMRALQQATQQPVQSENLSKAVTRGIRDCSIEAVRALNVRNVLIGAGLLALALLIGSTGGYFAAASQLRSNVSTLNQILTGPEAARWIGLIRMNNISLAWRDCQPAPQQAGGTACAFTLWTQLPHPAQ